MSTQPYSNISLKNAYIATYSAVGVSGLGAQQFATGAPVANPQDRVLLARLMEGALDIVNRQNGGSAVAMLIPAVHKVRP